jgi:high-affinity K+ transport system ATPase subunit B
MFKKFKSIIKDAFTISKPVNLDDYTTLNTLNLQFREKKGYVIDDKLIQFVDRISRQSTIQFRIYISVLCFIFLLYLFLLINFIFFWNC